MPARNAAAKASKASYTMARNLLPIPGTLAPGGRGAPGSIESGRYWFDELAAGTGAMPGETSGGAGDAAGRVAGSVGDLGGPDATEGLRGALPSLRRSCSGRRLYSSHFCFRSSLFA